MLAVALIAALAGLLLTARAKPARAEEVISTSVKSVQAEVVHEYGRTMSLTDNGSQLHLYVMYPFTDIPAADRAIMAWAQGLMDEARKTLETLRRKNPKAELELNVQYNSYRVGRDYVSIEELGFLTHSGLAHPREFFQTFLIDLQTKKLLPLSKVLRLSRQQDILELLRKQLLISFPEEKEALRTLPKEALAHVLLTPTGVEVLLERGAVLPAAYGAQRVRLSAKVLGNLFLIQPSTTAASKETAPARVPPPPEDPTFSQAVVDPSRPMIALSFDDGPSYITPKILSTLRRHHVRASFFVLGNRVMDHAKIVRQAAAQGCEILGHSWDHKQLTRLKTREVACELEETNAVIAEVTGKEPTLFRPPYGAVTPNLRKIAKEKGLSLILWSVDTEDWRSQDADKVVEEVERNAKDGDIILFHDMYETTAEAVARVVPMLLKKGFQLVTVSELLHYSNKAVSAGEVYYKQ
jgi:peptidoglycan/xylan/chitin deacetylase (PgdA/CDA1 family)